MTVEIGDKGISCCIEGQSERPNERLQDANFQKAQLQGANLTEADMMMADLRGARLDNVRLDGAYLQGADLRETTGLTREQVQNVYTDETTQLPADLS